MSDKIENLLVYLFLNYSHPEHLSNARTTKLVYLMDWRNCLLYGRQITEISWYFDNFGPFVWDIKDKITGNPDTFGVRRVHASNGNEKLFFYLNNRDCEYELSDQEEECVKYVIKITQELDWASFIELIYSTLPIIKSKRQSKLDLIDYARQQNKMYPSH